MRNIKLTLEYDGTDFHGWQIQGPRYRTVQRELQKALQKILKEEVRLIGSGRTDSGAHALGQVAHFQTTRRMTTLELQRALNAMLPQDIVVHHVQEVRRKFHAQYSVKNKTYRYTILNRKIPHAQLRNFSLFYPYRLDIRLMRQELKALLGRKDFRSFQATDPSEDAASKKTTIRTMTKATLTQQGDMIAIEITANGFLYKMVRNIVGTLLAIGSGQLPKGSMKKILKKKNRSAAGPTAPAHGLCLVRVRY